jgi:DNA-binding MarR family transcriptional regulator
MEHISEALKERNIILETNDPVVADGFTQVPNFILKNDALTVGEKITFAMFLTYAWNNDKVFPGQERLAKDIGVTRRSVNTFIKGLEKKGFLTIQRRGLGKTNIYTLKYRVQQNKSLAQKQRSRTS